MAIDQIQPALTADEWAELGAMQVRGYFQATADLPPYLRAMALDFDQFRTMAVANSALPDDDPRRITAADLEAIDAGLMGIGCIMSEYCCSDGERKVTQEEQDALTSLRAKLAALLPPHV